MIEQRMISWLIQLGIELINTGKVDLDRIITTDRLLIEAWLTDLKYDVAKLTKVYYKYENHIHDIIEESVSG